MAAINLTIDQLLLDSDNPRIGSAKNQREALQKIIDDQGTKLAVLAESIVEDGLSPIERLLVMREKRGSTRYVALEGNRRLAAMKILANPAVLVDLEVADQLQRRLERAAGEFERKSIEPVSCFAVATVEEATKWIYLRHTGENQGKGVVDWTGVASARFRGTSPALQALTFVREHGNLTDAQKGSINDSFPITTLGRLLDSKDVRKLIGVNVKERKLRSALAGEELVKPLRRMVLDLAEKHVNVSDLKNTAAQVAYIKAFAAEDSPNHAGAGVERDVLNYKANEFKGTKPTASRGRVYDPSSRPMLIDRKTKMNITSSKVAEIAKELRTLKMESAPHACAVLFRVFLELSTDAYMDANSLETTFKAKSDGRTVDKKLDTKVRDVIEHLVTVKGKKRKDLNGMTRALNDKGSPLHIDLLHSYVHNRFVTPRVKDLRAAWNDSQPYFEWVWA